MSPCVAWPKAGDGSIRPELNHVQSTDLYVKNAQPVKSFSKQLNDTGSGPAEAVPMQTASSSDLAS